MSARHRIQLRHNFETAHRLSAPDAPLKCQSIHGHSWWVTITLEAKALDERGMIVEFGLFKKRWRALLDDHLDHHLVVRRGDPVAEAILAVQPEARILMIDEDPTTEYLAMWIHDRSARLLEEIGAAVEVVVRRVHVQETSVNAAEYEVLGR